MSVQGPIKSVNGLVAAGLVTDVTGLDAVARKYAIAITPAVAALIDAGGKDDPMARQFVPSLDEDFLAALALMPAASGVALGFDRLVMLATGAPRIEAVLWAPVAE